MNGKVPKLKLTRKHFEFLARFIASLEKDTMSKEFICTRLEEALLQTNETFSPEKFRRVALKEVS